MARKKKEDVLINVLLLSLGIFYVGAVFVLLLGNILMYSYNSPDTVPSTMITTNCETQYDEKENDAIEEKFILSYDPLSGKAILRGFVLTPSLGYHYDFMSLANISEDTFHKAILALVPSEKLKTDVRGALEIAQGLVIPKGKEKIVIRIQKSFDTGPKEIECKLPKLPTPGTADISESR